MTTKYIARLNDKIVGSRKTRDRTYTHAVIGHGLRQEWRRDNGQLVKTMVHGAPEVLCWCGRLDLAQKQAARYRLFEHISIVAAEIDPGKRALKIRDQAHYDSLTEAGVTPLSIEK